MISSHEIIKYWLFEFLRVQLSIVKRHSSNESSSFLLSPNNNSNIYDNDIDGTTISNVAVVAIV